MEINTSWSYEEILYYVKAIRSSYMGKIAFFSYFSIKEEIKYKKELRNIILNQLQFAYWKREKIWEYINGDIEYDELVSFIEK